MARFAPSSCAIRFWVPSWAAAISRRRLACWSSVPSGSSAGAGTSAAGGSAGDCSVSAGASGRVVRRRGGLALCAADSCVGAVADGLDSGSGGAGSSITSVSVVVADWGVAAGAGGGTYTSREVVCRLGQPPISSTAANIEERPLRMGAIGFYHRWALTVGPFGRFSAVQGDQPAWANPNSLQRIKTGFLASGNLKSKIPNSKCPTSKFLKRQRDSKRCPARDLTRKVHPAVVELDNPERHRQAYARPTRFRAEEE